MYTVYFNFSLLYCIIIKIYAYIFIPCDIFNIILYSGSRSQTFGRRKKYAREETVEKILI